MKSLIIMRHAAAAHNSPTGDKGRPLSERGQQEAALVGSQLRETGISHVLCSSAQRTRDTLEYLGLPGDVTVEYMDALYGAAVDTITQRISEIDDDVAVLLVIGHAPEIPALSTDLESLKAGPATGDPRCDFPTATFTRADFEGSWSDVPAGIDNLNLPVIDVDTVRVRDL